MPTSVLYIEDEEDYQILVQRILAKSGLDVHLSPTGAEGLSVIDQLKPDLVILDINLPDTDGYSLCRKLRENRIWCQVPILMLTVRRRPEEWLKGFSSGADDYVPKPLNPPELIERVRKCIEGRRPPLEGPQGAEYLLVQAAVAGNRVAYEVLIQTYRERLINSLRALGRNQSDAEDLVSQVFILAYERLNQFRGYASFYTWLYRIAIHESFHQNKAMGVVSFEAMTRGDESMLPQRMAEPDVNENKVYATIQKARVHYAVSCVPKPYRQMLNWHFVRGMSYRAMGKRLRIPTGTVMSRLFKAKQLLREAWQNNDSEV